MSGIIVVVVLAVLVESVWETIKMVWQDGKLNIDRIGAILVGVVLAVVAGLDLFQLIGIPLSVPLLGLIFTGLLISRGANWVHDFFKKIDQ